jgi:hypothetical protein
MTLQLMGTEHQDRNVVGLGQGRVSVTILAQHQPMILNFSFDFCIIHIKQHCSLLHTI